MGPMYTKQDHFIQITGSLTSSNFLQIMVKALYIWSVVPVTVTILSGHDASEMFILAPLCRQTRIKNIVFKATWYRYLLRHKARLAFIFVFRNYNQDKGWNINTLSSRLGIKQEYCRDDPYCQFLQTLWEENIIYMYV